LGRYLTEDDEREGAPWVAVIGENVWRNRFAGDAAILGKTIQLGATPHSIVGVMPEGFAFPVNHRFWVPLRAGSALPEPLTGPELMVFGRLAPDATLASAQAELATLGRRTALALPKVYEQLRPRVLPYTHPFVGLHETRDVSGLQMMQSLFALLLVLVCLNVAILVYSRTAMRQAEIAIRNALGASRRRIVAQLFIEALVLSAAAALAGVAIAALVLRWAATATLQIAAELPFWMSFELSPGAVLYAAGLSVFAAAIVGIVPALKATGREVQTGLRIIGAGGSGMRLGKTWTMLIVAQVGFAVALLPPAVFNAWRSMQSGIADAGFAAEEFLSAQLGMDTVPGMDTGPGTDAAASGAREFTRRFADRQAELMRRLEAEPGVSGVTLAMVNPGEERRALIETQDVGLAPQAATAKAATRQAGSPQAGLQRAGRSQAGGETSGAGVQSETDVREVRFNRVDVNFFRTFEVPILAGRAFLPADIPSAGAGPEEQREGDGAGEAVVVNLPFAVQVFGGNALGRRIRYVAGDTRGGAGLRNGEPGHWYEIVGIVSEFPTGASPEMDGSRLKVYHAAAAGRVQPVTLALHVNGGDPSNFAGRLREIAAAVDPELHLRNILSLDEALRREQWIRRMEAGALAAVTLSVLLLSAAGIYSLMSITVSQRRKEIGIRMALGADGKRIVANIFSRALGQLAVGAAVGAALCAALEKASGGNLMQGNGTVVLLVVVFLMMAVGFVAALGPARRSLRIEPTEALREQ
jgi:cell division protein FtsX